jgi:hypothetical protein
VNGLYSLRDAHHSVKLAVVLFLIGVGAAYVFAFLMVRTYAGLSPSMVAATYAPQSPLSVTSTAAEPSVHTENVDLSTMTEGPHRVDSGLLIQDSHVHLLLYAIVAALETLIILGLNWPPWLRDAVIVAAFVAGLTDFVGQWMIEFGFPGFAWLTIASGWTMAAVYATVCAGTVLVLVSRAPASVS